jgi:hypothetical protein
VELAKAIGAKAARYIEGTDLRFNGRGSRHRLPAWRCPKSATWRFPGRPVVRLAGDVPKAARTLSLSYAESFGSCVLRVREGVHDTDQLLVVTGDRGVVATETEEREITVGD